MQALRLGLVSLLISACVWGYAQRAHAAGCVAPPPGLVSWWRGEGNGLDSAGTNNAIPMNNLAYAPGMVGSGFRFVGANDYLALPDNVFPYPTSGQNGSTPFSLELWFQTTNSGAILGQQDAIPFGNPLSGNVAALYVGTNGNVYAAGFWDNGAFMYSFARVDDGTFHHVALTFSGTNESLYLDGALIYSMPFVQIGYAASYNYEIGTAYADGWIGTPEGWFPFKGVVDEICLYNRALTPAEVAAIYSAGPAGKCFVSPGPGLLHRYSFEGAAGTATIVDSIRGANGELAFGMTNAPWIFGTPDGSGLTGAGKLNLNGTNGFVRLPSYLISTLSNLTLEAWITWSGPSTSVWQRILDFGISDGGANAQGIGINYLILSPGRGGTHLPGFEETTVNPFGAIVDSNAVILTGPTPLAVGQPVYLAVTYDPIGGQCKLFLNGSLIASATGAFNAMSRFNDVNMWLGRSQWIRDPYFNGTYDEFRIWEGILAPQDILSHYNAGPDQPFVLTQPKLEIARAGSNIRLSWPASNTTAFKLQSTISLSGVNWIDVTNVTFTNASYQVTLPATGAACYYRLKGL